MFSFKTIGESAVFEQLCYNRGQDFIIKILIDNFIDI